jgi:uncharacterized sodium:solute symporter family permease YidK
MIFLWLKFLSNTISLIKLSLNLLESISLIATLLLSYFPKKTFELAPDPKVLIHIFTYFNFFFIFIFEFDFIKRNMI